MPPSREERRVTKRGLTTSVGRAGKRLQSSKALRDGAIAINATGSVTARYRLASEGGRVEASEVTDQSDVMPPVIEVIGDAGTLSAIMDGKADAREEYLAGRLRVQGDLRYLSDLAVEIGYLEDPL